ncbi:PIN domain containing protein, putative [Trypanosoma equiperdum]|uniref:PIN domain-containing protein n=2 Tax=Trypanozoon TaxID=39700 RepID=Q4GZ40_TRYB2|nr:hypothetical protein TB927.1.1790 [Trypanosoma brucei brucei TREU927]CAJ16198.1 hypothetical protein TB927.1.1790 [Trypanosoma brucei brucei TREU927]SCU67923.1 PIN domain containing protein, putative [Trypanosoma equiperdum]
MGIYSDTDDDSPIGIEVVGEASSDSEEPNPHSTTKRKVSGAVDHNNGYNQKKNKRRRLKNKWEENPQLHETPDEEQISNVKKRVYVLDTCSIVEHIEWSILEEVAKYYLIIIPKKVMDELGKMEGGRGSTCNRVLNKLENEHTSNKMNVGFRLQRKNDKDKNVLSAARVNDDHILSCACSFRNEHDVVLVTSDNILKLKAYAEGIPTVSTLKDVTRLTNGLRGGKFE